MSWQIKKLGDLADVITKGTTPTSIGFKYEEEGVNFIKVESITSDGKFLENKFAYISNDAHQALKRSQLKEGDILFSIAGALGRTALVNKNILPANTNQALAIIRLKSDKNILKEYILSTLTSGLALQQIENLKGGTAQQNLSLGQMKSFIIPVPPLSEQKQIVETLDKAFEKIDKAIANVERNIENAEELFKSKLNQIFTEKGNDWTIKKLNEICEVKDGTHDSPKYINDNDGVPFVTQKNILNDGLSFEKVKFISKKDHESFYKRSNVAFNDILFSMIGANRGMACIVDSNKTFSIKNVGLIKSNDKFLAKFLLYYFKSPIANTYVNQNSSGSAQGFLSLTKLRSFTIPFTTLNKQSKVVESLDAIHDITKKILLIYKNRLGNLEQLKKSILEKAFKGELTNAA